MKHIFQSLKEDATVSIRGIPDASDALVSYLKLAGFAGVEQNAGEIRANKIKWQAAGAPLKRKQAPASNPWATLQQPTVKLKALIHFRDMPRLSMKLN